MNKNKRYLTTQRRMDKPARAAYCNGCGVTFRNQHTLMNHRRSFKCGGVYLSDKERQMVDNLRSLREAQDRRRRDVFAMVKAVREGRETVKSLRRLVPE